MLSFPDGNYVGQSNNVERRIKKHISQMKEGIHPNARIRDGVTNYGLPNVHTLCHCSLEDLNDLEIAYMDIYNCYPNGYNLKPGGGFTRNTTSIPVTNNSILNTSQLIKLALGSLGLILALMIMILLPSIFLPSLLVLGICRVMA
jgi:hypothetical protein